ncbi:MAG: hypothetical protein WC565_09000 [Parcubacteria group bacterium]|jgi:hypothetical protein
MKLKNFLVTIHHAEIITAEDRTEAFEIFWDKMHQGDKDFERTYTKVLVAKKTIDSSNADHPHRKAAIRIIEELIEPRLKMGINGKSYYELEDAIVAILEA